MKHDHDHDASVCLRFAILILILLQELRLRPNYQSVSHEMVPENKSLSSLVDKAGCEYVRFTLADMNAVPRVKIVSKAAISNFEEGGVGFYSGTVGMGIDGHIESFDAVVKANYGDIFARPINNTFRVIEWTQNGSKTRIGQVQCEPYWKDGSLQLTAPRVVATQQVDRLRSLGFELKSAAEFEFRMLKKDNREPVNKDNQIFNAYVSAPQEELLFEIERKLRSSGVCVETLQSEYGSGQFELTISPKNGIEAADDAFTFKMAVKEIAAQHDLIASFMTKIFPKEVGNSFHFNHSLWTTGTDNKPLNMFYDAESSSRLSETAMHWIGGLLKHAAGLTAICAPTVNCYRRLATPWAPSTASWGVGDRFSMIRAKKGEHESTYLENRLAGGGANPYLVLAAVIAAGIDGITHKIMPEAGEKLPTSLEASLKALQADQTLVNALGSQFVEWFCALKKSEITALAKDTPTEDQKDRITSGSEGQDDLKMKKELDMYLAFL